jgi:enamine deaminase RidA (YjgF/YER057c/UK114 family)
MGAETKLKEANLVLPSVAVPMANYIGAVRVGSLLFVSGHGPLDAEARIPVRGKLGQDLSVKQGYEVARAVGLSSLATIRQHLGSLDKVKRVVKVLGMVNSAPNFADQPAVMNGFSDLMVEVFGEPAGKHARSAVGMAALPLGIAVEVEMIVEVAE